MATAVFENVERVDRRTVKFTMSPTRVTYANSLRRAIQTEVSILGFRADMTDTGNTTDVKVFKNSTPMSNEMLADRVGLLPIVIPADVAAWDKDSVLFKLHVRNETDDLRFVTASDFECYKKVDGEDERQRVPNTQFFHPDPVSGETCLLAVLKPMIDGQEPEEIKLEAYASLGKGREHTRFNPTSQCAYSYTRDEDAGRIAELWQNWLREQKKVDVKELEKEPERKALLEREFRSLEIYRCFKLDEDGEPYSYDFTVESLGTYSVDSIVYQALLALSTLCNKYSSFDRGDLPETVEIRPADARLKGFDVWFTGEDHTLGNIIQTWLDDNKVDNGVSFVGYKIPHPLRDEMVLRIGVDDGKLATARLMIAEAAKGAADMFASMAAAWSAAVDETGGNVASSPLKTTWDAHASSKARLPKK